MTYASNLPPGVTERMIDERFGPDQCPNCKDDATEGEDCPGCGEPVPTAYDYELEAADVALDRIRDGGSS